MSKISKEELNAQLRAIIEKPAFSGSYADLTNKPTTMTPSTHTHAYADLTGKPTIPAAFSGSYADLTNKPTSFPPATHTHSYADLTNKPYEVTTADRDALLRIPTAQQVSDWSEYITGSSMIEASDSVPMKAPSFYYGLGRRTYWENHKDIIAGVPNAEGSAWSAMITIIPYYKADDDALTQIIYSKGGTFTRVSVGTVTATATWGAWQKYSTFSGNYNDLTNKPTSTTYTLPKATPNILGGIMPDNLTVQVDANGVLKSLPLIKSAKLQTTSITLSANTSNQAYNLGTTTINLLQVTKDAMNRCVVPLTGYYFYTIEVKGILGGTPTGGELTSNLVAGSSTILTTLTPTRNSLNFVDTAVGMSLLSELTTLTLNFSSTLTTSIQFMTVTVNLIALVTV